MIAREIGLSELGGTRHQSVAQFVFDYNDAIAIVASQDRRLSVPGRDRTVGKVAVIRPAEFVIMESMVIMTRKSFQIIFSTVCLLVLSCEAVAQSPSQQKSERQVVQGVVVDQEGDAVAAATVTLSSDTFRTTSQTDNEGHFHLESMAQESLILEITAEGFATIKQRISPTTDASTQLRFVLKPANVSAQVTVTATRTDTRLEETAASIVVLGQKELETTAALTLDDSLRQVPGFSLFRRSGSRTANPTSQGVSLRGLGASGASRALVRADGIPLNDPFGGWVYWDRVPRVSVAEVEVLRGSASQLYGSAAWGSGQHSH